MFVRWTRQVVMGWVLASAVSAAQPAPSADAHVLTGARAFRDGDWATALVEFRVALKLGAGPGVHWYEGAALARAGRFEEAVGAFEVAQELAAAERDPLLDYYRALACFEAHLWGCVAEVTEGLQRSGGPRIQQQVVKMAEEAKQLLSTEPPKSAIEACFARARAASSAALARAWLREASRLSALRADRFRADEAARELAERQK